MNSIFNLGVVIINRMEAATSTQLDMQINYIYILWHPNVPGWGAQTDPQDCDPETNDARMTDWWDIVGWQND